MHGATSRHEVLVVGAGQAGLAMGYFLRRLGRDFGILEAGNELGISWRGRWDSLMLFTPARYSALPGLAFPGDPDHYPTRDEVASYLAEYARRFDLPVDLGARASSLRKEGDAYLAEADGRTYEAEQVVVATGPFQVPFVPAIAEGLGDEVTQLHTSAYRRPADIPEGRVLVIGGGNSGYQIAEELSASHEVHLAVGSAQKPLPQRPLGRDLFWYLDATGIIRKSRETRIGRKLEGRDVLIGSSPRSIRRHGVELHGRAVRADGSAVTFDDGTTLDARTVIWATGYRLDHSWIELPIFDSSGRLEHRRGVTASPGLYLLGLTWQHTRGSALIGFVKDDAAHIAAQISAYRASSTTSDREAVGTRASA
jgi:putative flavoprotein involved in K+ transport